ncbi:MAG: aspartate ammonia-lyase [Candidatus Peregrinibacteria bacterium]
MKKSSQTHTRTERDALGAVQIPVNAYFGSATARALKNFQISGLTAPKSFQKALGMVKLAAAKANLKLNLLEKKHEKALLQACEEFIDGKFSAEFTLDAIQAGAGTSYNMNANEIIANRANELLGGKKGQYKHIHPNNHVNLAQSTNDVIPTATRIALLLQLPTLLAEIKNLEKELAKKTKTYAHTIKVGRTHLQDAVPTTFGQEFDAYKEAISASREFIIQQAQNLQILGIGGTALGTGINTDPGYQKLMIQNLSALMRTRFKPAKNLTETTHNMTVFLNFSAALRSLAVNLLNISNDLKIMAMGPKAGINEIHLPEVQPGSSIMPGKVNPSIVESMEMTCMQVLGNDRTIELAAQKSQLDLNVFAPIILYNILQSTEILTAALKIFTNLCIKGLTVNKSQASHLFETSLITATALAPYIGYAKTAEIVKNALKNKRTIREEVLKSHLYTEKELDEILSIPRTTKPSKLKKELIKKPQ